MMRKNTKELVDLEPNFLSLTHSRYELWIVWALRGGEKAFKKQLIIWLAEVMSVARLARPRSRSFRKKKLAKSSCDKSSNNNSSTHTIAFCLAFNHKNHQTIRKRVEHSKAPKGRMKERKKKGKKTRESNKHKKRCTKNWFRFFLARLEKPLDEEGEKVFPCF